MPGTVSLSLARTALSSEWMYAVEECTPATNHLIHETSPYLLQHARNPVDWYPWGPEPLEKARREEKPIFLSIGYSACHWCHVMEHESFEDADTAAVMNEYFVNIKVDREERPDLDHIYMSAVQMMTRHGGWPMSVFLTPELEPFYGGTYFPPEPRHGLPSFKQILLGVADAWQNRRDEVIRTAGHLTGALVQMNQHPMEAGTLSLELIDGAIRSLEHQFDPGFGGFGSAPKFPHAMDLKLCLRHWRRTRDSQSLEMVTRTLDHMARGGIYDHLGGGFHRYSTDERWLVPHFEKMLYDNALLAQVYLEAYQATGNRDFAQVAGETLDYVLREMTAPDGGFYSTQDADSEGVEGKFFVWSLDEIRKALGPELAAEFAYVYDVTEEGNWERQNILNRPKSIDLCARLLNVDAARLSQSLAASRARLLELRRRRVPPGRDEKVVLSWNGLMIDAMARGYQVLGGNRYLTTAQRCADFILTHLWSPPSTGGKEPNLRGNLLHCFKDGRARFSAYLDDTAALIDGLVSLYESDFDPKWLEAALDLAEYLIDQFWDEQAGGFFFTGRNHEQLITRVRDAYDGATPSGNSLATLALLRLGRLASRIDLVSRAEHLLRSFTGQMARAPGSTSQMLNAVDFMLGEPIELVLAAPEGSAASPSMLEILRQIWQRYLPGRVLAATQPVASHTCLASATDPLPPRRSGADLIPMLVGKKPLGEEVTLFVCRNYACETPVAGFDLVLRKLNELVNRDQ